MKLLAPAKINLFLHVLGKRSDGYHELLTLMCCVGLYDTIHFGFDSEGIRVRCTHPGVPEDETNLVWRAASLFFKTYKETTRKDPPGVALDIDKRIPVAAGLGGGSSDAAAALMGLNEHFGSPFSKERLMQMGLSIGADVPFFIFQKPALAGGIGEKLEAFEGLDPYAVVLVNPGFGVSTAETYKKLNLGLTKDEKKLRQFYFKYQGFDVKAHPCNDLEKATVSKHPEIGVIKESLQNLGAENALMSGSGPTVFGLFSDAERAEGAAASLARNSRWRIFCADMLL